MGPVGLKYIRVRTQPFRLASAIRRRARISRATKAAFRRRKNIAHAAGERVNWGRPPRETAGVEASGSPPSLERAT